MEIVWEGEEKAKELTLADIKVGQRFRFATDGATYRRVRVEKSQESEIYYIDETINSVWIFATGKGPVIFTDPKSEPRPVTLGYLKVGDHFRFQHDGKRRVCRLTSRTSVIGRPTYIEESNGLTRYACLDDSAVKIKGVKLVVPEQ